MSDDRPQTRLQAWLDSTYAKAVGRFPERKQPFTTASGLELDPLYGDDADAEHLGMPGEPPFTRGVQPTMYRGRLWTMRQYAGFATAEESNQRYRALLQQGQTGLSVAFDLPTQIGYDPDHPMARGEVGRVGVSIAHLDDMETLLDGIPLEDVSISMDKAEALAAGLPGAGPVVKVGGAHAANLTNPEPVNAAILEFLAGLPD